MRLGQKTRIAAAAMACLLSGAVTAEESDWEHSLAVYMVAASMNGKAGVRGLEADVDVSFSDILDNLDWGFMGAYRGERGPWAVGLDVMYLSLEADASGLGPNQGTSAKVNGDQLIVQLDGGYAITDYLGAYVGARYWQIDADVKIRGGGPLGEDVKRSKTEDWIDPVVGLRFERPLGERWLFVAKGDIGGFGVGSDFTWQATAFAAWKASEHARVMIGYRYIDVDYDDGDGDDRFLWDLAEGGPMAGFVWQF